MKWRWMAAGIAILLILQVGASCTKQNQVPVLNGISLSGSWISVSAVSELTCDAYDPEGSALSYSWSASGGIITATGKDATWTAPDTPGLYAIKASVTDAEQNETHDQVFIGVYGTDVPVILGLSSNPSGVGAGTYAALKCWAEAPAGVTLRYQWEVSEGLLSGTGPEVQWLAPMDATTCIVRVRVTADNGEAAEMTTSIDVMPNHAPQITNFEAQPASAHPGDDMVIECDATDIDGDELTYKWTMNDQPLQGEESTVTWTAPEDCGYYYCTVYVTDGRGGEASDEIQLRVAKTSGG